MKIYWGLRRSHEKVLANINRLERELGIDDEALLGPGPKKRELPHARVLSPRANHTQVISPDLLLMRPGAIIPVRPGGTVEFWPSASSVVSSVTTSMVVSLPRVELPPGVRLH